MKSIKDTISMLQDLVPAATTLVNETKVLHAIDSSALEARPQTADIAWVGEAYDQFWGSQRKWLIEVFADATRNHHEDEMYLLNVFERKERYNALEKVLTDANTAFDPKNCEFCDSWGRPCDCFVAFSWELYDLFTQVFLKHATAHDNNGPEFTTPTPELLPLGQEVRQAVSSTVSQEVRQEVSQAVRQEVSQEVSHEVGHEVSQEVGQEVSQSGSSD